ncbi:MAG: RICIN domain-containing protein [Bradyrhizobium sp.]|nr:RICIN domain-containing protein [Bradyrhizobium sp.]
MRKIATPSRLGGAWRAKLNMPEATRAKHGDCLVPVSRYAHAALSSLFLMAAGLEAAASDQQGATRGIPEASFNKGRISARSLQTFRGWGMSLAWEANDLYGGGRQVAKIKDPAQQSAYMDLLYGDPATRLTLGFNIARYNIGGGDDPNHAHMRPDAQMEGYQSGPDAAFDWTRDAAQRRMLQEAKRRGADIFEAASYSPPYWMTVSGCSSGSKERGQDNLRPEMQERFVDYLATVVKHFHDAEGIRFESVEPFNEPDGNWGAGGSQEGYSAPIATQNAVLPLLRSRLQRDGLETFVAGVDTNNISAAIGDLKQLSPAAVAAIGRFDTHDYHHDVGDLARLREYRTLAEKLHKRVWMSELGCCFADQKEKDDMWGALFMADSIRMDLRDLRAEAWVLWQPDWEVIRFDPNGGAPQLRKQYYALAQYSRFIRPGFQIVSAGGAYNTLAAYSPALKRLVLVTTNRDAPGEDDLDLTAFAGLPAAVTAYRTTSEASINLREETIALSHDRHIVYSLPARSITTYVIDGVVARSDASIDNIEGVHQVVSQGAHLCLNVAANSANSGAAIIPYSCGAYSNEAFNFASRGGGFYSIHTVNAVAGLCLNVSNGPKSPGDGKTRGASGNLIQWDCGDGPLPANELFRIEAATSGAYRIHVKSSDLCLEDPGAGGTLRQNHCDPAAANQRFMLVD